jgi:hypothetical protein
MNRLETFQKEIKLTLIITQPSHRLLVLEKDLIQLDHQKDSRHQVLEIIDHQVILGMSKLKRKHST